MAFPWPSRQKRRDLQILCSVSVALALQTKTSSLNWYYYGPLEGRKHAMILWMRSSRTGDARLFLNIQATCVLCLYSVPIHRSLCFWLRTRTITCSCSSPSRTCPFTRVPVFCKTNLDLQKKRMIPYQSRLPPNTNLTTRHLLPSQQFMFTLYL